MDSARPNVEDARIDPGTVIANYVVEDFVGQGTEGCVYVARDSLLGRQVALKTLRSGEAGETRGVEEARLLAGLEHPNIVRVYHARRHQGVWFVVFEYLAGGSLQAQLQRVGPLPLRRALEVLAQAASGLAHAHAAGILHRDIKPQNMLLSKDGDVKLADFGLAVDVRGSRRLSSQPVGTPAFLAPELWSGAPATPASDVFSLGACLFCVLTGRLPFIANDAEQLRRAHMELEPKLPLALPAPVREFVLRMMDKDPSARPSSRTAAESLRALTDDPYRSPVRRPSAPVTCAVNPLVRGGAEEAVRQTVQRGPDAPYLSDLVSALHTRPRGIELVSPNVADAALIAEVARERAGERYGLFARLALTNPDASLNELIHRRLGLPTKSRFEGACEQLLETARDIGGQPVLELCVPRSLSAERREEIEAFVNVANRNNVLCILIVPNDELPPFDGFHRVRVLATDDGLEDFEARLGLWIELATAGRYAFSRDGLRLASAICREEGRFWPRFAQDSLLITAAAGLPFVTSWAVLGARAQTAPLHSVDDVSAVSRMRPRVWPSPKVARVLERLRETGVAALAEPEALIPAASIPPKSFAPAVARDLASNT